MDDGTTVSRRTSSDIVGTAQADANQNSLLVDTGLISESCVPVAWSQIRFVLANELIVGYQIVFWFCLRYRHHQCATATGRISGNQWLFSKVNRDETSSDQHNDMAVLLRAPSAGPGDRMFG